ncbi:helix-turn-helix domain-containing protein [Rathayibacter sp. CAU 1779]
MTVAYADGDGMTPVVWMTVEQYCAASGAKDRTVRRWLAAGELQGAQLVDGKWRIPPGAHRVPAPADVVERIETTAVSSDAVAIITAAPELVRAPLCGLYTLEQAADALGTTPAVVRRLGRAGKLDLGRYGPHGALAVWADA